MMMGMTMMRSIRRRIRTKRGQKMRRMRTRRRRKMGSRRRTTRRGRRRREEEDEDEEENEEAEEEEEEEEEDNVSHAHVMILSFHAAVMLKQDMRSTRPET